MLEMKCTTAILVLYSNHFTKVHISSPVEKYLPNLHNLMYNCSSSVKGLTPNNQQEQHYLRVPPPKHRIAQ
jgi:hypothetical protein